MKILIVGAGPAGLYLAYLLKRHEPRHDIRIVEPVLAHRFHINPSTVPVSKPELLRCRDFRVLQAPLKRCRDLGQIIRMHEREHGFAHQLLRLVPQHPRQG